MLSDVSLNDGINCTIGHVGSTFCGPRKTWAHKCCEPYKYLGPNIFGLWKVWASVTLVLYYSLPEGSMRSRSACVTPACIIWIMAVYWLHVKYHYIVKLSAHELSGWKVLFIVLGTCRHPPPPWLKPSVTAPALLGHCTYISYVLTLIYSWSPPKDRITNKNVKVFSLYLLLWMLQYIWNGEMLISTNNAITVKSANFY